MTDILDLTLCDVQNIDVGFLKNNNEKLEASDFNDILVNLVSVVDIPLDTSIDVLPGVINNNILSKAPDVVPIIIDAIAPSLSPPEQIQIPLKETPIDILEVFSENELEVDKNLLDVEEEPFVEQNNDQSVNCVFTQDLIQDVKNIRDELIKESSPSDGNKEGKQIETSNPKVDEVNPELIKKLFEDKSDYNKEDAKPINNKFTKDTNNSYLISNKNTPTQKENNENCESGNKNDSKSGFNDDTTYFCEPKTQVEETFVETEKVEDAPKQSNTLSEKIIEQIVEKIEVSFEESEVKLIKIQLHPESLGQVNVVLKHSENGVSVKFFVQNEDVKNAINEHLSKLEEHFTQQNLKVENVEVFVETAKQSEQHQEDQNKKKKEKKVFTVRKSKSSKEIFESMQFKNVLLNFDT